MDLTPSRAAMVAAKAGHTPRPCAAMEAARSGVSLLSGGSVHLHLVDLRWRFRPRMFVTRVRLASLDGTHRRHRVVLLGTSDLLLLYLFGLLKH